MNVVQRPNSALDAEVEQMLKQLAAWTNSNGEAIYGTRPWKVYAEGPVRAGGGFFREDFAYTDKDIRFTTKGPTLYAIFLGWPADGKLVVRARGVCGKNRCGGPPGFRLPEMVAAQRWAMGDFAHAEALRLCLCAEDRGAQSETGRHEVKFKATSTLCKTV